MACSRRAAGADGRTPRRVSSASDEVANRPMATWEVLAPSGRMRAARRARASRQYAFRCPRQRGVAGILRFQSPTTAGRHSRMHGLQQPGPDPHHCAVGAVGAVRGARRDGLHAVVNRTRQFTGPRHCRTSQSAAPHGPCRSAPGSTAMAGFSAEPLNRAGDRRPDVCTLTLGMTAFAMEAEPQACFPESPGMRRAQCLPAARDGMSPDPSKDGHIVGRRRDGDAADVRPRPAR